MSDSKLRLAADLTRRLAAQRCTGDEACENKVTTLVVRREHEDRTAFRAREWVCDVHAEGRER